MVGAGITGLTAAWTLQKNGFDVTVFEKKNQPGGSIRSVQSNGWLVEYGPNTLQLKTTRILDFIEELGLTSQLTVADPEASKRYIVKNGELQQVPAGLGDFLRTSIFSTNAKLQVIREPFVGRGKDPAESLASFVKRRLGREILENAVDPFVAGIYAGKPDNLSVRLAFPKLYNLEQQYGSLIAGAVRKRFGNKRNDVFETKLVSFDKGLQVLPETISGQLSDIKFETEVRKIEQDNNGFMLIAGGVRFDNFDRIFINIPLYRLNELMIDGGGAILESLNFASYPPLSVIATGYESSQVKHPLDGFGFLVPSTEKRKILGSLFNSSLFPCRAPEGHVLITTFLGGMRQPELASKDSGELKEIVSREHSELLGVSGSPKYFDHIYWPNSIPQYTVRYDEVLNAINHVEKKNPGVHLIGNFRGGISLPDCIENGLNIQDKLG